jgi:hypothetical protein
MVPYKIEKQKTKIKNLSLYHTFFGQLGAVLVSTHLSKLAAPPNKLKFIARCGFN